MGAWQTLSGTGLGTGVARTQIDVTTSKPTQASELVEFIPYQVIGGLSTTVESLSGQIEILSDSINLLPKTAIVPPVLAGLGATFSPLAPILHSYITHTPVEPGSSQQIQAFGTPQVANTVQPIMGVGLHYATSHAIKPIMAQTDPKNPVNSITEDMIKRGDVANLIPEKFYDKPANESSTGTAAAAAEGNTIQINGGKVLTDGYFSVVPVTPTIGDPFSGDFTISSNDFDDSMPLEQPFQPISAFLGATGAMLLPKMTSYPNLAKGMKTSCLISTRMRQEIVQAVAGSFVVGVGYQKRI